MKGEETIMTDEAQQPESKQGARRGEVPTPQEKRDALLQGAGKLQVGRREAPQPNEGDRGRVRRILIGLALSVVVVGLIVALAMGLAADISL